MSLVKVTNEIKKSVIEVETWTNLDKQVAVDIETGWRFSTYTLDLQEQDEPIDPENKHGFIVTDYQIEDMDSSDSFSFSFNEVWRMNGDEPLTEDEQGDIIAELETLWEDGGWSALEEAGWDHYDTETFIYGPLIVEEVE